MRRIHALLLFVFSTLATFGVDFALGDELIDSSTLRVEPSTVQLFGELDRAQVLVTSVNGDGRSVDLTRDADFQSLAPEVAVVSTGGRVTPVAPGQGSIRVRVGTESVDIPVAVSEVGSGRAASFIEDVIPALTKAGCNQGACHGGQFGQGEFKLSLAGFAPEQDHPAIVRGWGQRRVSFVAPGDSLLLKKALGTIPHGGGRRMRVDSSEYHTLLKWIGEGAPGPLADEPRLTDLEVTPREREYAPADGQQLRVVAHYSNGSQRDVTHSARYDSLSSGIATVSSDGYVTAGGTGQAAIMVRYGGLARVSIAVRPFADSADLSGFQPRNLVDEHVLDRWRRLGLQPSPLCTDAEFIRRAFLAAIGTLPTPEQVERFLASTDPSKRDALVDELLGLTGDPQRDVHVAAWSAYWAQKWGDLLRNNREKVGEIGMWAFANWIRTAFRENRPMDQFTRDILLARGSIYQNGQANYFKVSSDPAELAETTAQVFLGVRLQCAQCHQHPFESISQADYYGMAAFFTRVTTKRSSDFGGFGEDTIVRLKTSGSIRHPRTGEVVVPTPLGGAPLTEAGAGDQRRQLADWLTSSSNPFFARNIVNRTWGHLMGAPLVNPIDDLRETNPASNPPLLEALAADFVESGYNLRHLMRRIMTSSVFQLSSTATTDNAVDTQFFSHYPLSRLPAEVLLDALDAVCGTQQAFTGVPLGTRAIELPDPNFDSYFLDTLGRPKRVVSCECERTAEPNLAQVLHVANGELVQEKLTNAEGRISRLLASGMADDDCISDLYLAALSRFPTDGDLANCRTVLADAPDRRSGMEDILWALINSREFLFNH